MLSNCQASSLINIRDKIDEDPHLGRQCVLPDPQRKLGVPEFKLLENSAHGAGGKFGFEHQELEGRAEIGENAARRICQRRWARKEPFGW